MNKQIIKLDLIKEIDNFKFNKVYIDEKDFIKLNKNLHTIYQDSISLYIFTYRETLMKSMKELILNKKEILCDIAMKASIDINKLNKIIKSINYKCVFIANRKHNNKVIKKIVIHADSYDLACKKYTGWEIKEISKVRIFFIKNFNLFRIKEK